LDVSIRAVAVIGEREIATADDAGQLHFLRLEDPAKAKTPPGVLPPD
jgi:hypothetical protein